MPRHSLPGRAPAIALVLSLALAAALGPRAAHAAGERGSFALMTGLALPNSGDQAFLFGVKAAYHVVPFMRTSAFFETYGSSVNSTVDASSVGASTHTSLYGVEGAISLDADISLGLKLGLMHSSSDVRASDGVANSVAFSAGAGSLFVGPTVMYDQPLGARFGIGVEGAYAFTFSSAVPKAVLLSLVFKYLF